MQNQLEDENVLEYIKQFDINELFLKDDKGSFSNDFDGDYPERIKKMSEENRESYIYSWIKKNAEQFWIDKPEFAAKYLEELNKAIEFDNPELQEFYSADFSYEFLLDTVRRLNRKDTWFGDLQVVEIDFKDDNYKRIY